MEINNYSFILAGALANETENPCANPVERGRITEEGWNGSGKHRLYHLKPFDHVGNYIAFPFPNPIFRIAEGCKKKKVLTELDLLCLQTESTSSLTRLLINLSGPGISSNHGLFW